MSCSESRTSVHIRPVISQCLTRRGQSMQGWRAVDMRMQSPTEAPGPARRLAVGRLWRQRGVRLPVRCQLRGCPGEGEEPSSTLALPRPRPHASAQQRGGQTGRFDDVITRYSFYWSLVYGPTRFAALAACKNCIESPVEQWIKVSG
jgi:hypothetical protein